MQRNLVEGQTDYTDETEFAGLNFQFTHFYAPSVPNVHEVRGIVGKLPISVVSHLVGCSYTGHGQAVLDALSPFQLMSKAWATRILRNLMWGPKGNYQHVEHVYIGSWFGQQALLDHLDNHPSINGHCPGRGHTELIDKDELAMIVARKIREGFIDKEHDLITYSVCDAMAKPLKWSDSKYPGIVVWNGLEHFHPREAAAYVQNAPAGTTFLCQATNMPADDHQMLYHGTYAFSNLWGDRPVNIEAEGWMKCVVGTRYLVAFTVKD